jgi:hypothetical protein
LIGYVPISVVVYFPNQQHYFTQFVFFENNLEKFFFCYRFQGQLFPVMLSLADVAIDVFQGAVMVYFFTVNLGIKLLQNNIELLIVNPRDIEALPFAAALLARERPGDLDDLLLAKFGPKFAENFHEIVVVHLALIVWVTIVLHFLDKLIPF